MRPAQHPQHQLESTHARGGVRSLIGRRRRRALAVAGLLFVLLAAVAPWVVFAATVTWTDGGSCPGGSPWSTAACWNNGAGPVPSNGDDVVLATIGSSRPDNCDISRTLNSITINSGPDLNLTDVGGCSLGLQSGGFITSNHNNNATDVINI